MYIIKPYTSSIALKLDSICAKADELANVKLKPSIAEARKKRLANREVIRENINGVLRGYHIGDKYDCVHGGNFFVIEPVRNFSDVVRKIIGKEKLPKTSRQSIQLFANGYKRDVYLKSPSDVISVYDKQSVLNIRKEKIDCLPQSEDKVPTWSFNLPV